VLIAVIYVPPGRVCYILFGFPLFEWQHMARFSRVDYSPQKREDRTSRYLS
jgi:hypothetical protein